LQQWSVARAFNARLKEKMDEAGIEVPVPQMQLYTSTRERHPRQPADDRATEPQRGGSGGGDASSHR
ncbi:MAG TPA: hypothetical protein VNE00_29400, partial [Paraburkholderia sp.]|nr:hypothetical protein [Paraburkholderia sp.]